MTFEGMEVKDMETNRERLLELLEAKGYTDTVDASLEISLYEYGIARNPKTGDVVYCQNPENWGDDKIPPSFDWTSARVKEVKEEVKQLRDGFFEFVGTPKKEYLKWIRNANLSNVLQDVNGWNGLFNESCNWDFTEEGMIHRLESI